METSSGSSSVGNQMHGCGVSFAVDCTLAYRIQKHLQATSDAYDCAHAVA
jgi:hypothetical protein